MFELNGGLYECRDSVAPGGSQTYLLPNRGAPLSVMVAPIGGSALVEFSISKRAAVRDGTALWKAWPAGVISYIDGMDTDKPVTAFRVQAVGECTAVVEIAQGA